MILIDYNAIAISNVVTQKLELDENLIRHMILNSLRLYRSKHHQKFGELVICTDGMKNWRYDAYPHYKFKRKDARKESKMDWKELFRITNMVQQEIKDNLEYIESFDNIVICFRKVKSLLAGSIILQLIGLLETQHSYR